MPTDGIPIHWPPDFPVRFSALDEACDCARDWSRRLGVEVHVLLSRSAEFPESPFCLDTDGFTRAWESTLAVASPSRRLRMTTEGKRQAARDGGA